MVYKDKFVMCVIVNGQVQPERADRSVPVPFGTEYTLRFRNKHANRRAVVRFTIDGEDVSGGGYVIGPDSFIDIQRHSKRDAAFKLVPLDSPEAVDAGKNRNDNGEKGVIEAKFYLERERVVYRQQPVRERTPWPQKKYPYEYIGPETQPEFFGLSHTCDAAPAASFNASLSDCHVEKNVRSRSLRDAATVEGSRTGQTFQYVDIQLESQSVDLMLVLRGFDPEVPQYKSIDDENADLRRRIEEAKRVKDQAKVEENQRLKAELDSLLNS